MRKAAGSYGSGISRAFTARRTRQTIIITRIYIIIHICTTYALGPRRTISRYTFWAMMLYAALAKLRKPRVMYIILGKARNGLLFNAERARENPLL